MKAEIDLVVKQNGKLHWYEFKYADEPKMTKSIGTAIATLGFEKVVIAAPDGGSHQLARRRESLRRRRVELLLAG